MTLTGSLTDCTLDAMGSAVMCTWRRHAVAVSSSTITNQHHEIISNPWKPNPKGVDMVLKQCWTMVALAGIH